MEISPLKIEGAWVVTPQQFSDDRGTFAEGFRQDHLAEVTGSQFITRQTNISVSKKGALRGIHYADVPPSQAKYVTALSGTLIDFIVDVRVGSATFGQWDSVVLDTVDRRSVFLSEGLGHCLYALEDSTAMYLCSTTFNPDREHGINPLDPEIGLSLPPGAEAITSDKDCAAPNLSQAQEAGLLPSLSECLSFRHALTGSK